MRTGLVRTGLERLASLKLTLFVIIAFGAGVLLSYSEHLDGTWALAVPLTLFAVNLAAAVATKPVFRRQRALLIFHLGLIAIVLLLAAGRLTYLRGSVEITEGAEFDGTLTAFQAGPWHWSGLDQVHFGNDGFQIGYSAGMQRDKTRNQVHYVDAKGVEQRAEIGDQTPLVLAGYRFYTSPNKGFAPTFAWYPAGGAAPLLGAVHLPSYPIHEYRQAREWQLPATTIKVWTMLQFDEVILDPEKNTEFRLPNTYKVIVRIGEVRREMQVGEAIELPEGKLVYDGLRTWMGYTVFYDWTIHWLLTACIVSVGALGWHFWKKFAAQPWNA
jgi:cytochrome c biogenesis protein ResB